MGRVVIPGFRKIEVSGGGEGTSNYNDLTNKPSINNVPLVGNLNTVDLKLTDATLTEEGVPAEAKTVGAKLEEQSTSLTALKKETTVNLLKPTLETTTQNGVTCTNNGDGTYTLNGTASDKTNFFISGYYESTEKIIYKTGELKFIFSKDSGIIGQLLYYNQLLISDTNDIIISVSDSRPITCVNLQVAKGLVLNNVVIRPMITTNLNATYEDFVPYTGDTGQINSDVASLLKRIEALESLVNNTDTAIAE